MYETHFQPAASNARGISLAFLFGRTCYKQINSFGLKVIIVNNSDSARTTGNTQHQLCFPDSEEYEWKETHSGN